MNKRIKNNPSLYFPRGLPTNPVIHGIEHEVFDDDCLAENWAYADFVMCVNCHGYGYVEPSFGTCPSCECTGCLADIREEDVIDE